jgi:hemerythrin
MPFVWKEKYRLGINEIDRQHQTFLLLLNKAFDFYTHTAANLPPESARQQTHKDLIGLRDFAKGHFTTEEAFMTKYAYPKLLEHRREHVKLLDIAADFENKIDRPDTFHPAEWIEAILQWYDHHVQHADRELGEFLQGVIKR